MSRFADNLRVLGPGLALAATGIGAGDMVAASVAGARYGEIIIWAAVYGAILKLVLNEGVARWQLATGQTLLEGWFRRLGTWAAAYFAVYLVIWSFIVAGALMAACGLAASALFGGLSVAAWGAIHAVAALALVTWGGYRFFEGTMKVFIAALFVVIIYGAFASGPDWPALLPNLVWPRVPEGAAPLILAVMGGVGGSVTMLSYGYWIREKGWRDRRHLRAVRIDLGAAYLLTGLFGVAMMIIAAGVSPEDASGPQLVLEVARRLEDVAGPWGRRSLLVGFWAAVFSSMIGVWQGVPYLFADGLALWRGRHADQPAPPVSTRSWPYRGYLLYLAFPPMLLLLLDRPVMIIVAYAVLGALFMPFLAGTLLIMNRKKEWVGELVSGRLTTALLWTSLGLFVYLAALEISRQFGAG